jgi:uncharacterized RDD family membrane protein YckC
MTLTDSVNTDASVSVDLPFFPAGNIARGFAFLIDLLVCLAIAAATIYGFVFISVLVVGNKDLENIESLADLLAFLLCCLYFVFSYSSTHQASLGKKMMGLILVSHDGQRLSKVMAVGRVLVPVTIFALGYVLLVGYVFWLASYDQPGSTEAASSSVAGATLLLFYFAFFAPYMTVFFSKNRLTLIDMLCKTRVVQKRTV